MYTKKEIRNNDRSLLRRLQRKIDSSGSRVDCIKNNDIEKNISKKIVMFHTMSDGFKDIDLDEENILKKSTRLNRYMRRK